MRLHRFFVSENIGDKNEIAISSTELVNQIQHVFRLKKNDAVIIFDGSGFDFECIILNYLKDNILLKITKKIQSHYIPKKNIYLCAALVKKDTFEWIVEKATELGVTNIIPIMAERSEKKSLNEVRLKRIAIEASEQSGRGNVPIIDGIISLEEILKRINTIIQKKEVYIFHTEGEVFSKYFDAKNEQKSEQKISNDKDIFILIGPEGGWSSKEIEMFHKNNFNTYCLGNQVLRSETAVIASLSQFVFTN